MQTLYIAQKMFSLFGKFEVKNQNGSLAYVVKGKPSLTKTLRIENAQGKVVGSIHKKMISILPTFEMVENGKEIGEIRKDISLFKTKLSVSYNDWTVHGSFFTWNYYIKNKEGKTIARIDQEMWHMTDHYAIHYEQGEDPLVLLMVVLAIDALREESENDNKNANNDK